MRTSKIARHLLVGEVIMPLFSNFQLGGLTLPNRIVMAPMTRSRAKTECAWSAPREVIHPLS